MLWLRGYMTFTGWLFAVSAGAVVCCRLLTSTPSVEPRTGVPIVKRRGMFVSGYDMAYLQTNAAVLRALRAGWSLAGVTAKSTRGRDRTSFYCVGPAGQRDRVAPAVVSSLVDLGAIVRRADESVPNVSAYVLVDKYR